MYKSESERYFIVNKFSTILSIAKVYATKADRDIIKHDLFKLGMIVAPEINRMATTNSKDAFELLYVDEDSDDEIIINDMEDIVSHYPFHCEICGKPTERTGRNQKMCPECWKNKHRKLERERMRRKK
jgi:rubrerythrin